MTPCLLLTLTSPPVPAAASVRDGGQASGTRRGWAGPGQDHSGLWLRNAAAGLCVLAAAAAAVSFTAQYRMVDATRHLRVIAALEAAIPDAAALVFACLGIALALHGRRAVAALRDLAAGRGDLLAGVAGVLEEFSVGETFLLAAQDFRL